MNKPVQSTGSSGLSASWRILRRINLTQWILIAMVIGVGIGWAFPEASQHLRIISNMFLRMIKCILVPLVFATLVVGIAGHSDDLRAVGRLALKSIIYFEIVTTLALVFGLVAVNIAKPGVGVLSTFKIFREKRMSRTND